MTILAWNIGLNPSSSHSLDLRQIKIACPTVFQRHTLSTAQTTTAYHRQSQPTCQVCIGCSKSSTYSCFTHTLRSAAFLFARTRGRVAKHYKITSNEFEYLTISPLTTSFP